MKDNMKMKYVITDHLNYVAPFIFPESVEHSHILGMGVKRDQVVSAGFVELSPNGQIHCFGKSVSLDKICRAVIDSKLISKFLGVEK